VYGSRLILAPKSSNARSKSWSPILQGIVKLPGSFSFGGNFLNNTALTSYVKATFS
jgi:hypothetical protein